MLYLLPLIRILTTYTWLAKSSLFHYYRKAHQCSLAVVDGKTILRRWKIITDRINKNLNSFLTIWFFLTENSRGDFHMWIAVDVVQHVPDDFFLPVTSCYLNNNHQIHKKVFLPYPYILFLGIMNSVKARF